MEEGKTGGPRGGGTGGDGRTGLKTEPLEGVVPLPWVYIDLRPPATASEVPHYPSFVTVRVVGGRVFA